MVIPRKCSLIQRKRKQKITLQEGLGKNMRNKFDEQLSLLNNKMVEMGAMCESLISFTSSALLSGNINDAGEVKSKGREIDKMEREIEAICLKLLLQQQPVARDLRQISAALKMITDMERIGDQAEDIAEIIPFLGGRTGAELTDFKINNKREIYVGK